RNVRSAVVEDFQIGFTFEESAGGRIEVVRRGSLHRGHRAWERKNHICRKPLQGAIADPEWHLIRMNGFRQSGKPGYSEDCQEVFLLDPHRAGVHDGAGRGFGLPGEQLDMEAVYGVRMLDKVAVHSGV